MRQVRLAEVNYLIFIGNNVLAVEGDVSRAINSQDIKKSRAFPITSA